MIHTPFHSVDNPVELTAAIGLAQKMLTAYGTVDGDIYTYCQAHGALTETVRILLRALGAEAAGDEKGQQTVLTPGGDQRCPAAHPEDPTPCDGPPVVTVLDKANAGADGCKHHAARLLASLDGGRVYALPDAPAGAAIRVFKAAGTTRPFAWTGRGEDQ
ncbi:hypothetical protein ACFTY8_19585 [Streptomyces mirabilis]|uniref:hypothetical protein n=1 Tax=Streptomyces mirabilis TaxID=68239 RepID=UPI00362B779D